MAKFESPFGDLQESGTRHFASKRIERRWLPSVSRGKSAIFAQSGNWLAHFVIGPRTSALGQKQTFAVQKGMPALPPKGDMCGATRDVRFGPIADIAYAIFGCFDAKARKPFFVAQ